jgi:hypothetical protein
METRGLNASENWTTPAYWNGKIYFIMSKDVYIDGNYFTSSPPLTFS